MDSTHRFFPEICDAIQTTGTGMGTSMDRSSSSWVASFPAESCVSVPRNKMLLLEYEYEHEYEYEAHAARTHTHANDDGGYDDDDSGYGYGYGLTAAEANQLLAMQEQRLSRFREHNAHQERWRDRQKPGQQAGDDSEAKGEGGGGGGSSC